VSAFKDNKGSFPCPSHEGCLTTQNKPQYSFEEEAGWAPEPVWVFWRRKKSLAPIRI